MKTNRFWLEIIVLASAAACAVAVLIATVGAAATAVESHSESEQAAEPPAPSSSSPAKPSSASSASSPSTREQSYEGMVTCSRCGAKHPAALGKSASDCARECVHGGAAFALVDGDKTYQLDGDLTVLKKVAGQRARIGGVLHGKAIKVASVAPPA